MTNNDTTNENKTMTTKQLTTKITRAYKLVSMLTKTTSITDRTRNQASEFDRIKSEIIEEFGFDTWENVAVTAGIGGKVNGSDLLA